MLDFQFARYTETFSPTGNFGNISKTQIAASLKKAVDGATYDAINSIMPDSFSPLALRWRCSPEVGLPVSPFKVYKRPKTNPYPMTSPVPSVPGSAGQQWFASAYWDVSFSLKNNGDAGPITIAPMDENGDPYADLQQTFTIAAKGSTPVKLRFPNIFGITILSGNAALDTITGTLMEDFLNDSKWQHVEDAGLPFKATGPDAVIYQNLKQGYDAALVTGYQAAINRLGIAQLFYNAPKYLQPDGVTLPDWPLPPAGPLVDSYHFVQQTASGAKTGILYDIQEMLTRVYNDKMLYDGRQALWKKEIKTKGFTDNGTQSSEGGTVSNPVCSTTLMSAATDCWSALGLGFGTTAFATLGGDGLPDCDYMVSATFQLPVHSTVQTDNGFVTRCTGFEFIEIAAAAHMAMPLGALSGLSSEVHSENRPMKMDERFSDDVKVYWNAASRNVPQSYAVAVKDASVNTPVYLNAQRAFLNGIKKPHLPTARADADADDIEGPDAANVNRFFHHRSERSDTAPVSKNYYVAANDVFGRWSAFAKTGSSLPTAPQVMADIISGQFLMDTPTDPLSHNYNGTLELTVAWHWDDRQPLEINIGGRFQSLLGKADLSNPATPPGIALNESGSTLIDLSIAFLSTTPFVKKLAPQPGVASPAEATVTIDKAQSNMPHLGVYKIQIKGFRLAFNSGGKMAFAAYLRSRQAVTPGIITPAGKPKLIYAIDPRPRTAPVLPPDIQWGSLPDAQNVSRYRVSFQPVPGVAGYAIYRATEASLREKGGLQPIAATDSMETRRDQLMQLAVNTAMKDAFIRLNREILGAPEADVELPGDLNGLYIYAITTFTAQRVESDFGATWLYVGVPRRYTPPSPVLSAFTRKLEGTKVNNNLREVTLKVELPQGVRTDRVAIFRTAKSALASSLDLMGPAAFEHILSTSDAGWKAYDAAGKEVKNAATGTIAMLKKTETVSAGWQPLYYRAAGFGATDKSHGKLPGRSGSSNLAEVLVAPPDGPPTLLNATLMAAGKGLLRLEAFTNGSIHPTPYGSFRMRVEKLNLATNVYEEVFTQELPLIPKKFQKSTAVEGTLWRLEKDAVGNYEYEYYVTAERVAMYRIIITDPLGRSSSATVSHNQPRPAFRNFLLKPLLLSTELSFELNISNKPAEFGNYLLDIVVQKKVAGNPVPVATKVYSGNLDAIGDVNVPSANPSVHVGSKSADGYYQYNAVFKGSAYGTMFSGAGVLLRLTDPDGIVTNYQSGARAAS